MAIFPMKNERMVVEHNVGLGERYFSVTGLFFKKWGAGFVIRCTHIFILLPGFYIISSFSAYLWVYFFSFLLVWGFSNFHCLYFFLLPRVRMVCLHVRAYRHLYLSKRGVVCTKFRNDLSAL